MHQPSVISLEIAGAEWKGWENATSTRRLNAVCGEFNLSLADKWSNTAAPLPPVAALLPAVLRCDGEAVHTGYITADSHSLSASFQSLSIVGRDKSGDMIECSAYHFPGQWLNVTLKEIAARLAAPFGIDITAETDTGEIFPSFQISQGETAFAALDRACKLRGVYPMSNGSGGLVLAALGSRQSSTALVEGKNIISFSDSVETSGRYSQYTVLAQRQGSDDVWGASASEVMGEAKDPVISRYRPLVITAESQMDPETAQKRAQWEARTRAAASFSLSIAVYGWRDGAGNLWQPNTLVKVSIPSRSIEGDFLIVSVASGKSVQGSQTTLELKDPAAFAISPTVIPGPDTWEKIIQEASDPDIVGLKSFAAMQKNTMVAELEDISAEAQKISGQFRIGD